MPRSLIKIDTSDWLCSHTSSPTARLLHWRQIQCGFVLFFVASKISTGTKRKFFTGIALILVTCDGLFVTQKCKQTETESSVLYKLMMLLNALSTSRTVSTTLYMYP